MNDKADLMFLSNEQIREQYESLMHEAFELTEHIVHDTHLSEADIQHLQETRSIAYHKAERLWKELNTRERINRLFEI